jgi:hypothetical protein
MKLRPTRRATLPLSERDVDELQTLRASAPHRVALERLVATPVNPDSSEAALLHAIFEAGVKAITDQVAAESYAAEAADQEAMAERRATIEARRERRPSWADEA